MNAVSSFFSMGGYGGFVWPSYGIAVVVMVAVLVFSIRSARARERELDLLQQMRPDRARRRANRGLSPQAQPTEARPTEESKAS